MTRQPSATAVVCLLVASFPDVGSAQTVRYRDAAGQEVERRCQPAEWPKRLPALDEVVDSAALVAAVQTLPQSDSADVVVSVLFQSDGTTSARVIEPGPSHAGLLDVVSHGARLLRPQKAAGAVRIRVRTVGGVAFTVERSVYCPPESPPASRGPGGVRRTVVQVSPGDVLPQPGRRIRMEAELTLDEAGRVSDVRLMTRSGMRELDDSFLREQRQRVFLPALLDGHPLASWVRTGGAKMRL